MKKLLIIVGVLFILARLGDIFLCNSSKNKYTKNAKELTTSTEKKPYYDCITHKKFFYNGHCTSCELQKDINKDGGFLDRTKSY